MRTAGKLFLVVYLISISSVSWAIDSNDYLDSLKNQLSVAASNSEDSLYLLCRIAWESVDVDNEQVLRCGKLALKLSEKMDDPVRISEAVDAAAWGYRMNGDKEKAKLLYHKALKIGIENNLPLRTGYGNFHLGKMAYEEGDFTKAEDFLNTARFYFRSISNYGMMIECDNMLMKVPKDIGHTANTIDTFINDLEVIIREDPDTTNYLMYYLNLANLFSKQENKSQSLHYIQLAVDLAERSNNKKGILKSYNMIANYFRDDLKNYEAALDYFQKVLGIYQSFQDDIGVASAYNQIGNVYKLMGNDSLALDYFWKSLTIGEQKKHRHTRADAYKNIGEICYLNQKNDQALSYYLKSYTIGCDVCPDIKFHSVLIDVGNVYLHINKYDSAYTYYQKSLVLADSSGSIIEKAVSLLNIGNYYHTTRNRSLAISSYQDALDLAVSANIRYLKRDISHALSLVYAEAGDFRKAYGFIQTYNSVKDSLEMLSRADNMARYETKFEFQNLKMQKELELKESKLKAEERINEQTQWTITFIGGFVLMTILGIVVLTGYRRKRRDNILLEKQKQQIEEMSERVHQADQMKLNFFTNISHEFRTPLTLVIGLADEIYSSVANTDHLKKQIGIIKNNAGKLLHILNQMLDLRRLDHHGMKLCLSFGDISDFIKGVAASFENFATNKHICIDYDIPQEISGYYDKDKLEKIISNLVHNAIKYIDKKDGRILVSLKKDDEAHVLIRISDNGIGISKDVINDIFDRFYQTSNLNNGSGIGLALVKELIEFQNGTITVESNEGEGTAFSIKLPVKKEAFNIRPDRIELVEEDNNSVPESGSQDIFSEEIISNDTVKDLPDDTINERSILIVEDNPDLRNFVADIFRSDYVLYEASNGKEGLEIAVKYLPDVIISDIMMPLMDGYTLCESIKKDMRTSHIPVILLTAKNNENSKLYGYELGADDYLIKPFNRKILRSRVENLVHSRLQLIQRFSNQFNLEPKEIYIADAEKEFLEKTISIIENHISDPDLDVDLLAGELGVSRTQLYRKLKALTDYSANQFIRIIRLKRAAQILKHGQNNLAEVMDKTGFSNYSYFNNCFKNYFGKTPKEYSEEIKLSEKQ